MAALALAVFLTAQPASDATRAPPTWPGWTLLGGGTLGLAVVLGAVLDDAMTRPIDCVGGCPRRPDRTWWAIASAVSATVLMAGVLWLIWAAATSG